MNAADRYRKRLSFPEVIALCIVVVLVTVAVHRRMMQPHFFFSLGPMSELEPLQKYGLANRHSRNFEELIVRDFFQDKRDGVFLDVGANHYRNENNSYFLETSLGWSGIAVDALSEFAADYKTHRPRTRFVAMFASDVPDSTVKFFVPADDSMASSSTPGHTVRHGAPGTAREVPTTTLNALLAEAGISKVDFMSMDIELAEPKALAGFDVERYQPALVCIEGHPEVRQQILDYFARHHYTVVGKYLRMDPQNIYFTPLKEGAPQSGGTPAAK
jgi:FkbM family methyltransferase